nr:hypothetical protein [Tanacetum cinerariifolium]
ADGEAMEGEDISILNSLIRHEKVLEKMKLPITTIKQFKEYIGSGETLLCENLCSRVKLDIQGLSMEVADYGIHPMGDAIYIARDESLRIKRISLCHMNGAHYGYDCLPQVPVISNMDSCYNQSFDNVPQTSPTKFPQALQTLCEKINKYVQEKQEENNIIEEQSPKVSSQYWKTPIFFDDDDDDDEESSIPLRDIIYELPLSVAIAPDFPITDSLSMGDEHLSTIPEKELDKVIKSSVEDLFPIPCESKDLSDIESECDVLICDDFKTFSNPLFESYDDSTSSDDKSFSDDDVLKENFKIYSNPLFDEEVCKTHMKNTINLKFSFTSMNS